MDEVAADLALLKAYVASSLSRTQDFEQFLAAQPAAPGAETRLLSIERAYASQGRRRVVGVLDGVFDLTHVGHYAAIRQARRLVDYLIVLVNGDADTELHKGPLVYNEQERRAMVEACKWVDEAHIIAPYHVPPDVLETYKADCILHGDDLVCDENGVNIYDAFVRAGTFRLFKRTHGVSTTDVVERVLNLENDLFWHSRQREQLEGTSRKVFSSVTKIVQFFAHSPRRPAGGRIGLTVGAFDLLNFAHVAFLRRARQSCDFLIVGLYEDRVVQAIHGRHFPLFTLSERMLSLLSLRHVDDVIINAPYRLTPAFLAQFDVTHVFYGKNGYLPPDQADEDPYAEVQGRAALVEIDSQIVYTLRDTVERVKLSKARLEGFLALKKAKEERYYAMDAGRAEPVREVR